MVFKEIFKSKLKEGDFLWRYIDLHKLIDLATNKVLHFTRTDKFTDPFEGVTYQLIVERYLAKISTVTNSSIDKALRDRHNTNNILTLENYETQSAIKQKTQFINCWIRSQRESIAMWNLYSNRDSIAIRAKPKELTDYFRRNLKLKPEFYPDHEFICGSVKYLKLNPPNVYEAPALPIYSSFKKDVAYDYEKEFRLLIATPTSLAESNTEFFRYEVSPSFINILEIVCHPGMNKWKFNNVKSLCKILDLPEPRKSETEIRL